MNGYTINSKLADSHHITTSKFNTVPRLIALTSCLYISAALPVAAYANAAAIGGLAAAAASALGAAEGIAVPAAVGAAAAAAAVGAFALTFCATSYIMGTDLCSPSNPETGGGIGTAINDPAAAAGAYIWISNTGAVRTPDSAGCVAEVGASGWWGKTIAKTLTSDVIVCTGESSSQELAYITRQKNPAYDPTNPSYNSPDVAGDNIANNPRAAAGIGGAAAAKARGASDSAAESAARAAAAATGTGNPSRDRAAGNTGAAAGAAAAAAEAAGGSKADVDKAAKDAAATAAAAADKAAPQDKTCQSNGASIDGRYCTDATAQPKPNSVPVFCQWAVTVCGWMDWTKQQNDEVADLSKDAIAIKENAVEVKKRHKDDSDSELNGFDIDKRRVSFSAQCPAPVNFTFGFMGHSQDLSFKYDPLCDFMSKIRPLVIASSYLAGAYIVVGAARREE